MCLRMRLRGPSKNGRLLHCAISVTFSGRSWTRFILLMWSRDGRRQGLFESIRSKRRLVAKLLDASVPKLAAGCRWGGTTDAPVVLFPEGMIRVEGTGRIILELCDGHFSLAEIVQKLETQFMLVPKGKIRVEVLTFLEQLHAKRI